MKPIRIVLILTLLAAVLVLTACGGAAATATTAPTSGGSTSAGAGLDGKTILEKTCQACHQLTIVERERQDAAGWTRTVDTMIQKGAKLTTDEKAALIQYLAETYK